MPLHKGMYCVYVQEAATELFFYRFFFEAPSSFLLMPAVLASLFAV